MQNFHAVESQFQIPIPTAEYMKGLQSGWELESVNLNNPLI